MTNTELLARLIAYYCADIANAPATDLIESLAIFDNDLDYFAELMIIDSRDNLALELELDDAAYDDALFALEHDYSLIHATIISFIRTYTNDNPDFAPR